MILSVDFICVSSNKINLLITAVGTLAGVLLAFSVSEYQKEKDDIEKLTDLLNSSEKLTEYTLRRVDERLSYGEKVLDNYDNLDKKYKESGFPIYVEDEIITGLQKDGDLYSKLSPTLKEYVPRWNESQKNFNQFYKPYVNNETNINLLKEYHYQLEQKKKYINLETQLLKHTINEGDYVKKINSDEQKYKKIYEDLNKSLPVITSN